MEWITSSSYQRCLKVGDKLVRAVICTGTGWNVYDISGDRAELIRPLLPTFDAAKQYAEGSVEVKQ